MGGSLCKTKKRQKLLQAGSVLDRVISQASNEDQCLLYKLANYKKGGELVEAYNIGGQMEVERLIKEQFGILMYADGKGQVINRAEYLRWKFRGLEQVVLPIEASLSAFDPLAKWTDHEACWQMQYRGSLGETLLHVLIICDTKIHTRLARTLIKCFPKLALDVVEGEEYLGAGALHLAIAYNNNELVQDLVEAGANVNQRAIGSFFLPRDQQRYKPAKHTDYEGLAYLGEFPLAWAACCANESVYNLLLDSGAHPDFQDSFGNMILHMVVVCDKLDMFGYALRHPKLPASNGICNNAGLTPLTLACKLGRAEVFREMLELSSKEFWRYSNITCSAYTLNALDTLLPNGKTNWNSALFIILNGTKEEHLDMLDGGIIQRLLEEKWKTFARNQFLKRLLILFTHLVCLSLAVYLRPTDPDIPLLGPTEVRDIARYAAEVGTLLGVLSYVVFQQGDEIKNQGLLTFLKQQSHAPAKAIFLVSNLLILACIPFRLVGDRKTEEAILVFAVPGSWFLLMFFAGAVRLTGPFVTMIYSMITGDMLTFGIIYTVVLFGFSQSFYFLYKGYPGVSKTLYHNYPATWMALFQITMGNYDYSELSNTTYPSVSKAVFALFMVFVPILLLNMLIAMMGNTYAHVIEQSEKEWMKQWAKIVVTLERAVPHTDAHRYLEEYSISLGPSDDPNLEQRGVMVIKSKSKTRAKQRKGAVANWKRVGKVTITALRKRGLTGEQMRCLMWGRESINTPVKIKPPPVDTLDPKNHNIASGFGGALTTALDIMAFTHDLDINGATPGLNVANGKPPTAPAEQKPIVNNPQLPLTKPLSSETLPGPVLGSLSRSHSKDEKAIPVKAFPIKQIAPTDDPLRELVLCSNKTEGNTEKLNLLATQAANIKDTGEVCLKHDATTSIKSLVGIFAGTETLAKKAEELVAKRYSALDPSDSDGFRETPLLGRVSRTRRAKSANIRHSAKLKNTEKAKLCRDDSSSSLEYVNIGYEPIEKEEEEEDYAEKRIRLIRESLKNDNEIDNLRPINIDQAVDNENNIPITQPVTESTEDSNLKFKKRRPKTAKTNRVSPAIEPNKRRGHSANDKSSPEHPESPPDPLEPWSVRGIATMNTILAWENDEDSSI